MWWTDRATLKLTEGLLERTWHCALVRHLTPINGGLPQNFVSSYLPAYYLSSLNLNCQTQHQLPLTYSGGTMTNISSTQGKSVVLHHPSRHRY